MSAMRQRAKYEADLETHNRRVNIEMNGLLHALAWNRPYTQRHHASRLIMSVGRLQVFLAQQMPDHEWEGLAEQWVTSHESPRAPLADCPELSALAASRFYRAFDRADELAAQWRSATRPEHRRSTAKAIASFLAENMMGFCEMCANSSEALPLAKAIIRDMAPEHQLPEPIGRLPPPC